MAEPAHFNISPHGFHLWAKHFYKAKQDFISPNRFSLVPYFLLLRAIELQLKAIHFENKTPKQVKSKVWS